MLMEARNHRYVCFAGHLSHFTLAVAVCLDRLFDYVSNHIDISENN